MLHREIPFLRIILPLCAGIISGYFFHPETRFLILSAIPVILLFLASLYYNTSLANSLYGLALTSALYITGLFLYTEEKKSLSELYSEETVFSGILDNYPEEKKNRISIVLKLDNIIDGDSCIPVKGSVLLYHRKTAGPIPYLPGDRLIIQCTPIEIQNRGNPYEFNYKFYMENHGIAYYAFTDEYSVIRHLLPEKRKLKHLALIVREKIINMFRNRGMEEERVALVSAILLGQKTLLDNEQKQSFMKAGVMHIMAVSGLHAMILSLFVYRMLFFLKGRMETARVIITIIILFSFAFITGLTPSVLRAAMMYSFLQTGKILKRPVNNINSVLASAFILIMIRPSVIFDSGFLLSYSAVIFIICFYRDLYSRLSFRHYIPDLIWQSAAVTIIAQLGTLPLTVMFFNRFPVWFILSNIIIVPLATILIITGVLSILTYPVYFLSFHLMKLLGHLSGLTEYLTGKASSLPFSTIENIGITTGGCIFLMATIYLTVRYVLNREKVSVLLPVYALLGLVIISTARDIMTRKSSELIVYNTINSTTVGIRTGKNLQVYSDSLFSQEVNRHSAVLRLKKNISPLTKEALLITAENKNILITAYLTEELIKETTPTYIILTTEVNSCGEQTKSFPGVKNIILGSGVSGIYTDTTAPSFHVVKKEGAFYVLL
ncbi:MAG TPA: ComEC/Rec2 family competence protein [Bacteroidales bacterium]|mgnify:CR=1 FL=1|nr:ComEC/Rec2 family competence protein [Bacteroidales bacterium]